MKNIFGNNAPTNNDTNATKMGHNKKTKPRLDKRERSYITNANPAKTIKDNIFHIQILPTIVVILMSISMIFVSCLPLLNTNIDAVAYAAEEEQESVISKIIDKAYEILSEEEYANADNENEYGEGEEQSSQEDESITLLPFIHMLTTNIVEAIDEGKDIEDIRAEISVLQQKYSENKYKNLTNKQDKATNSKEDYDSDDETDDVDITDIQKKLRTQQMRVEQAQDEYNSLQDEMTQINEQIEALQTQVDKIDEQLAPYREELADIAKWEYTSGAKSLVDYLLNEQADLNTLIEQMNQLEKLSENKQHAQKEIVEGEQQIKDIIEDKSSKTQDLEEKAQQANKIIAESKQNIEMLQTQIEELREEQKEYLYGVGAAGSGPAYDIPDEGDVLDFALSRIGCPYVWGASGDNAFDCSGLVMWAYAHVGISLPHNTEAMYAAAKEIVPLSQAQPGDVLYASGHVGLCTKAGASEYVHAPTSGDYVRLSTNIGWSGFNCALRF